MKVIKPGVELFERREGDTLEHIERCGRVCYKSESKIGFGSAEKFCKAIIARGHEAVLEHHSFIFRVDVRSYRGLKMCLSELEDRGYPRFFLRFTRNSTRCVVSGNVRAWRDFLKVCVKEFKFIPGYTRNFILGNPVLFPEFQDAALFTAHDSTEIFAPMTTADLNPGPEQRIHYDITLKFICDRGVSHEIVRHRPASYCQESTRYCNYSNEDFGSEITVIDPPYLGAHTHGLFVWEQACEKAESVYFDLLNWGCTPQEARGVLPTHLKTEVVMTAPVGEWMHFSDLRCSPAAHPQMREVAMMAREKITHIIPPADYPEEQA